MTQFDHEYVRNADWIIVGSGLTGCTLARLLAEEGLKVLVLEKREALGGNVRETCNANGTLPLYGPHIFHTNSDEVMSFLSRFTAWRGYEHKVETMAEGSDTVVPLPVNFNTINKLFCADLAAAVIKRLRVLGERSGSDELPLLSLLEASDDDSLLSWFAQHVYSRFFLHYTVRMWGGRRPEDLLPSVTGRVPIRLNNDDRYFRDAHQFQPKDGFNQLISNLLLHPNIKTVLGFKHAREVPYERGTGFVWTGPIDEYFDHQHGQLPYRSLSFKFESLDGHRLYRTATRNNTEQAGSWTRRTICGLLYGEPENCNVVREYPADYSEGTNEPYYPVPEATSRLVYDRYYDLAVEARDHGIFFAGRLGRYQYLNMDQAVASALTTFKKELLPWQMKKQEKGSR